MRFAYLAAAAAFALSSPAVAQESVSLTFTGVPVGPANSYTLNGLLLTSIDGFASADPFCCGVGASVAAGSTANLSRADGGIFNFFSLTWGPLVGAPAGEYALILGFNYADGTSAQIVDTRTIGDPRFFTPFFELEDDLSVGIVKSLSASFTYNGASSAGIVDEILLRKLPGGGSNPIPEPATWAMMILGFGAIGAVIRRAGGATREWGIAAT